MDVILIILIISLGLSMDSVAVAISIAISLKNNFKLYYAFYIALWFSTFQMLMPLIGWQIGKSFLKYLAHIDHWIASLLLIIIGFKMIVEATINKNQCKKNSSYFSIPALFFLSIATSIDAFAIGLSISFLKYPLVLTISIIGITTFLLTSLAALIGEKIGKYLCSKAELTGGIILIIIAIKILFEHLNI